MSGIGGMPSIFIPDKYRTVRYNTGHLATLISVDTYLEDLQITNKFINYRSYN